MSAAQHKLPLPGKRQPSIGELCGTLAARVDSWGRALSRILRAEARGEEVDEWDRELSEGHGLREVRRSPRPSIRLPPESTTRCDQPPGRRPRAEACCGHSPWP